MSFTPESYTCEFKYAAHFVEAQDKGYELEYGRKRGKYESCPQMREERYPVSSLKAVTSSSPRRSAPTHQIENIAGRLVSFMRAVHTVASSCDEFKGPSQ